MKKRVLSKIMLKITGVILIITFLCNNITVLKSEATINWGTSIYISGYGQEVDSITINGVTVTSVYAPRNQVSNYDSDTTFCCAAFVKKFYQQIFGIGINNLYPGNQPNIYSGSGSFTQTSSPKIGDIAGSSGHWAIVKEVNGNEVTLIEQNAWNSSYTSAQIGRKIILPESSYWFWRYSGNSLNEEEPLWYESLTPANFGDMVYATIDSTVSGRSLVPEDDGNVVIRDASGISDPARYTWKFQRDSQGWYRIVNMYNSKSLDILAANTASGTNVQTFSSWDTHAQKWYVYCLDEAFCLRPMESECVLDVAEGLGHEGNNVQIYENNGTAAQRFTINPVIVPAASTLSVNANVEGIPTAFNWTSANNAVSYQLKIVNSEADSSETYTMPAEITSYELDLKAGKYKASVYTCRNGYRILSNTVSFTVYERPELSEDGWYYTEKLPADITNSDYEIQYKHTYQKTATASPGADWTQGELASSKYENIGDSFTTAKQVATSDTCVMTDYYYYHFCGPSTGNVANYEQTSEFTHYDSIYPEYSVYVQSTGMDGEYPYFLLGWGNDDNAVYCKSGTTCDGSYGTHGARSKAWYRMATYQNRQLVNYYYYTKQSDWETKADNTASVITYRYRIKNSEVTGDVNLDGSTNIADAVTFQQYLANMKVTLDGTLDLNNDNAVNVFDLIILKRILINN